MKMEVLSAVQNHQYQGQFGVIGSTKVKDWTSPLTPPPPPPPTNQQNNHPLKQQQQQEQLLQQHNCNPTQQTTGSSSSGDGDGNNTEEISADVVDGRQPSAPAHQQYYRNQHHAHQYQYQYQPASTAMEAATAAVEGSINAGGTARYAYNNNLLYCDETAMPTDVTAAAATTATTPIDAADMTLHTRFVGANDSFDAAAVRDLSQRLQAELRAAKSRHLACTEVSLPWDLTPRIAAEIIRTSEREPCGVRGCSIFIEFEDEPNNTRRIASFKMDPNTVSTFELYLTLKNDKSGWTSKLPQFLKNLTRSSTIQISPDFTLTKNKLYSCE